MTPTTAQIERVAMWCHENGQRYFVRRDGFWIAGERGRCGNIADEWQIVGIIAEACKAADVSFDIGDSKHGWYCQLSVDPYCSNSPAYAAILAASAYVEQQETTDEP